jgi:hypothetical protein
MSEFDDKYLVKENEDLRRTITRWQGAAFFLGLILFLILLAHFAHGTADEPSTYP